MASDLTLGNIRIGDHPTGEPIKVTQTELCSGCYILGIQGQGKTSLLEQVIYEQVKKQMKSIIVLAVHSGLVRNVIARLPQEAIDRRHIYLLDVTDYPYPFSFNIFACRNPQVITERLAVKERVTYAFTKLWPEVETQRYFKEILELVVRTLIECPELTLAHTEQLLEDSSFRNRYIHKLQNRDTIELWRRFERWPDKQKGSECKPFFSRMQEILNNDLMKYMLCQKQGRIDFRKAIEEKEIILIHLPVLQDEYKSAAKYIGTFLMSALYGATFSFGKMPEKDRPGFTLIVDEFQNFATSDYATLFSQGRQYGLQQLLAHQYRAQLDEVGMGTTKDATLTAHTIVAFRPNPNDVSAIDEKFKGLKRRQKDIIRDVVLHPNSQFEKHRNVQVREFYHDVVLKLQAAAKMPVNTWVDSRGRRHVDTPLPQMDFGLGLISFDPADVELALKELNDLLYFSQKQGGVDESRKSAFLRVYGKINGVEPRSEKENRNAAFALERLALLLYYWHWSQNPEEVDRLYQSGYKDTIAAVKAIEHQPEIFLKKQFQILYGKLNSTEAEREVLAATHQKISRHEVEKLPPEQLAKYYQERLEPWEGELPKIQEGLKQAAMKAWRSHNMYFDPDYIKRIEDPQQVGGLLTEMEGWLESDLQKMNDPNNHFFWRSEQRRREYEYLLKEAIKIRKERDDYLWVFDKYRVEIAYNEKLAAFNHKARDILDTVLSGLIAEPIALDKAELDIPATLRVLATRQALVNIGDSVYEMVTIDLNEGRSKDEEEERLQRIYDSRIGKIREQTRQKYCRPRAQVERDIYGLVATTSEEETQTDESVSSEYPVLKPTVRRSVDVLTSEEESNLRYLQKDIEEKIQTGDPKLEQLKTRVWLSKEAFVSEEDMQRYIEEREKQLQAKVSQKPEPHLPVVEQVPKPNRSRKAQPKEERPQDTQTNTHEHVEDEGEEWQDFDVD